MREPFTPVCTFITDEDRRIARRVADKQLDALRDYPFHASPSQLSEPNRSAANDWLLEHAPWLWQKPRIKVYVSMKTGTCFFITKAKEPMRFVRFVDSEANMFGVRNDGESRH